MDLRTVSSVRSIFRRDLVKSSVFLGLDDRFPRLDSSKMHSWLPVMQRLQGGPCSAPTHFIFKRRHTVHARDPLVDFGFGSSFSADGLALFVLSSVRGFFLLLSGAPTMGERRLPFALEGGKDMVSAGGVPMASES